MTTPSGKPNCVHSISSATQAVTVVWIPREKMGLISGKGGSVINQLAKKTNAKIKIDFNKKFIKDNAFPLKIRGTPEQCTATREAIDRLLAGYSEIKMSIEESHVGLLLGRGGSKHAEIQQTTGAFISFESSVVSSPTAASFSATIIGTAEQRAAAKEAMGQTVVNSSCIEMLVHKSYMHHLRIHNNIRYEITESPCDINFSNSANSDGFVYINIKGSAEACNAAKNTIEHLLNIEQLSNIGKLQTDLFTEL